MNGSAEPRGSRKRRPDASATPERGKRRRRRRKLEIRSFTAEPSDASDDASPLGAASDASLAPTMSPSRDVSPVHPPTPPRRRKTRDRGSRSGSGRRSRSGSVNRRKRRRSRHADDGFARPRKRRRASRASRSVTMQLPPKPPREKSYTYELNLLTAQYDDDVDMRASRERRREERRRLAEEERRDRERREDAERVEKDRREAEERLERERLEAEERTAAAARDREAEEHARAAAEAAERAAKAIVPARGHSRSARRPPPPPRDSRESSSEPIGAVPPVSEVHSSARRESEAAVRGALARVTRFSAAAVPRREIPRRQLLQHMIQAAEILISQFAPCPDGNGPKSVYQLAAKRARAAWASATPAQRSVERVGAGFVAESSMWWTLTAQLHCLAAGAHVQQRDRQLPERADIDMAALQRLNLLMTRRPIILYRVSDLMTQLKLLTRAWRSLRLASLNVVRAYVHALWNRAVRLATFAATKDVMDEELLCAPVDGDVRERCVVRSLFIAECDAIFRGIMVRIELPRRLAPEGFVWSEASPQHAVRVRRDWLKFNTPLDAIDSDALLDGDGTDGAHGPRNSRDVITAARVPSLNGAPALAAWLLHAAATMETERLQNKLREQALATSVLPGECERYARTRRLPLDDVPVHIVTENLRSNEFQFLIDLLYTDPCILLCSDRPEDYVLRELLAALILNQFLESRVRFSLKDILMYENDAHKNARVLANRRGHNTSRIIQCFNGFHVCFDGRIYECHGLAHAITLWLAIAAPNTLTANDLKRFYTETVNAPKVPMVIVVEEDPALAGLDLGNVGGAGVGEAEASDDDDQPDEPARGAKLMGRLALMPI